MCGIYVLVASAALGIDFGWERDQNGNVEYTIRLEQQAIDALKNGNDIFSDLPPGLRKVRCYKLTTKPGPLPHQGELPEESAAETEKPTLNAAVTAMSPTQTPDSAVVPAAHQSAPQTLTPESTAGPLLVAANGTNEPPPKSFPLLGDRPKVGNSLSTPIQHASEDAGSPSDVVPPGVDPNGQTPARPWWPLTLCLLGLFASLGGNVFLGWVTADQRGKYRDLVQRLRTGS